MVNMKHIHIITVGYHAEHVLVTLKKVKPDDVLILYMFDEKRKEKKEVVLKGVEKAISIAKELGYPTEAKEIKGWGDLRRIFSRKAVFTINLTGARKILALMIYATALSIPEKVEGIYYVHDANHIEELPKAIIPKNLTKLEREILLAKSTKLSQLAKELGKPKPLLLRYLKRLHKKGLIKYHAGEIERKVLIV